jgi:hypothetical protein
MSGIMQFDRDSLFAAGLTEPDERYVNKFVYAEERVNVQGDTITVEVFDDYRGDDVPFYQGGLSWHLVHL